MDFRAIRVLAGKEFCDHIRNRWVLVIALVFTCFALVIAYFGAAQQGTVGFQSVDATIASLVSLVIYLIPLIALLLGFDAIVGEAERGSLDLLLSMPITRLELLLGKYLGLAAALALSTATGFGLVALVMARHLTPQSLWQYGFFVLSSILLGMAFLSLALMVSAFSSERARASGLSIALWFFFVLVFDLLLLGALVASAGRYSGDALAWLLLLNPADVFRILNIATLDGVRTLYGLSTVFPEHLSKPWLLLAVLACQIVAPLLLANRRLRQQRR
jgi:Cu-processing system permease protein